MSITLRQLLRDWAIDDGGIATFDAASLDMPLDAHRFGDRPGFLRTNGAVPDDGMIYVPRGMDTTGTVVFVKRLPAAEAPADVALCILQPSPHVVFALGGSRVRVATGRSPGFAAEVMAWNDSRLLVGDDATSNGMRIVLDRSTVVIGRDALISNDVLLQGHDQHGILDARTLELLNDGHARILVGEHVWLGRRCVVMPDVAIGAGSIVGTGAVVTRDIPPFCAAAGVPARVVREGTSWTRSPRGPSPAERAWLETRRTT